MSVRKSVMSLLEMEPVSHRPPLTRRFGIYSATAFVIPVVVQVFFPEDPSLTDELVWLVTLVPAFLLSLHYGVRGAFVALIMGTVLFIAVQLIVALNFTPVPRHNFRIGVPSGGSWHELLNGDARLYGGSGQGNLGGVRATPVASHDQARSIVVTLPPLAAVIFRGDEAG